MRDLLHSEIDRIEELRAKATDVAAIARTVVANALADGIPPIDVVGEDGTVVQEGALTLAAQAVELHAAGLTTDAMMAGVGFAQGRRQVGR